MEIIQRVCTLSGSLTLLEDIVASARHSGIPGAIRRHDNPRIFDWLMDSFSFQGISDRVARDYLARYGNARWVDIKAGFDSEPSCPKLRSYWLFSDCRYDKGSFSCHEPDHIDNCALPRHRLRNGRLNQLAYSFYLFVGDIAQGDLIGWIDQQFAACAGGSGAMAEAIVGPLRGITGLSDKILTMTLSQLLLGAGRARPRWFAVGKDMIAIDTLVHNFFHRTGILDRLGTAHAYGPACYAPGNCADILRTTSQHIDARQFNAAYPTNFPRFIQHAVWRYCAADGLNLCNGNRIDDKKRCQITYCSLFQKCDRKRLKPQ
ncbi:MULTISPECIES: hypothetical protein [unclassified Afipia]|uniref:hypothetical protein n=1 Tax=unclassified Afipia TaxID=2642050 RepID=UPI001FCBF5F8|nr:MULTISPECIES: hypothetical protein [unclassified Afipia]